MTAILAALGIFLLGVSVFGGCVFLVRRVVTVSSLQPNNETVSHYLGIVIGIYGIFSGFVIVSLWEQQQQAEANIVHEASELRTLFRLAGALRDDTGQKLQRALIDYGDSVVRKEWALLVVGDPDLHLTHPEKDRIWELIRNYKPQDGSDMVIYEALVAHHEILSDSRRNRCYDAQRSLPPYLWMILAIGSVLSIGCTLFIGTENVRTQASLTGVSGGLLLLLLFVVYDLQNPLKGYWTASPLAFELALKRMKDSSHKSPPEQGLQVEGEREVHF